MWASDKDLPVTSMFEVDSNNLLTALLWFASLGLTLNQQMEPHIFVYKWKVELRNIILKSELPFKNPDIQKL